MSYILDALKRADSERERGSIPGLHAEPAPLASADVEPHPELKRWVWLILGLAVLLLGSLAWRMMARVAPQDMAMPVAPLPATVAARPAPAQVAVAAAAVPQGDTVAPLAARPPALPSPLPETTPPPRKPLPALQAAAPPAAAPPRVKEQAKAQAKTEMKTDAPSGVAASESRLYSLNELPEDIQRQLPALTISGSSYSENPAHRMLIINGQVFHEGEKPTAELVLEQIKPKAAVLSFRGYRYSLGY